MVYKLQDLMLYLIVFSRVAGMMISMPVFSQNDIPAKIRIYIALGFCIVITPLLAPLIPYDKQMPFARLGFLCLFDLLVGFSIGLIGRSLLYSLDIAGNLIALTTGLSSAAVFNPAMGSQTPLPSSFLVLGGTMVLLALDLHHLMIQSIFYSYHMMPFGGENIAQDMTTLLLKSFERLFSTGLQLAYPFLILGIVFNLALGVLNKMVPQMQVFFVAMPVQILAGLGLMAMLFPAILFAFARMFDTTFKAFLGIS